MQSKLPLLPSGPGGVRKSTVHGPWRKQFGPSERLLQGETRFTTRFHRIFGPRRVKRGGGALRCAGRWLGRDLDPVETLSCRVERVSSAGGWAIGSHVRCQII